MILIGSIVVGVVVGAVMFYRSGTRPYWSSRSNRRQKFSADNADFGNFLFFTAIFTFIGAGMTLVGQEALADEVSVEYNLAALADGSSTSGQFFLGSGSIDSKPVFFYYAEDDGAYTLHYAKASAVTIRETTGAPKMAMECSSEATAPEWIHWPFSDPEIDCNTWDDTTFYIPEGSIKNNYILDAQ